MSWIDAAQQVIAADARIGQGVRIAAQQLRIDAGVCIEDDAVLEGDELVLEAGSRVGRGTRIAAQRFQLGHGARIEADCKLSALSGMASEMRLGDHALLGASSTVLVPVLLIGDYTKLHNHALINGYRPCYVGHNCWIGQNCVLNANDVLFIGNNVCIGTYTSLWTHAFFGQLIEGFTVNHTAPTVLEDDVWLVGSYNTISPGLAIGERTMVLTGSVVLESVAAERTVAGAPARDVTDRLPPVRKVTPAEKLAMMRGFVDEFVQQVFPAHHAREAAGYRVTPPRGEAFRVLVCERVSDADVGDELALVYALTDARGHAHPRVTWFDLTTKRYTKRRTEPELQIIAFMNTYRARFVPFGQERIGVVPTFPA